MRLALSLAFLIVVTCTTSCASSECNFNSQCGTGRYCSDSICRQDCATRADCKTDEFCSSIGQCLVMGDSGPVDAGRDSGTDAGNEDAGHDAGPVEIDAGHDSGPETTREYLATCTSDSDCDSDHCVSEGGGHKVCSRDCTSDDDCADWHFCLNAGPGEPGYCAFDDIGKSCTSASSSGACNFGCAFGGEGAPGHCTHLCQTAADCPGGFGCSLLDPTDLAGLKYCTWDHKTCDSGYTDCPSELGWCDVDISQCTSSCVTDADCPRTFSGSYDCITIEGDGISFNVCEPSTFAEGESGEACSYDEDCRSGLCARPDTLSVSGICLERCTPTAGCMQGFGCNAAFIGSLGDSANICVPAGTGRSGDACSENRDCRSGTCSMSAHACIDSCQNGFCPPGFTCTPEGITVGGLSLASCRR